MRSSKYFTIIASLFAGLAVTAAAQPAGPSTNQATPGSASTSAAGVQPAAVSPAPLVPAAPPATPPDAIAGSTPAPAVAPSAATNAAEPAITSFESGTNGIMMNFHYAPLSLVLDHLAKSAGFIINSTTDVRGNITILSKGPVTKDEAVELLQAALRKNGYAVTRTGRILTIIDQGNVKTANLDITTPYNPDDIQSSDEVITALIHIRYASAPQLMANLEVLLPTTATVEANESANTLIMVATKTDIKRMLKIINALDASIATVSSIKVMPLKYADAKDTANLITQLFVSQSSGQTGGGPGGGGGGRSAFFSMIASRFSGGGPGGPSGAPGGPGGAATGSSAAAKVIAVGDDRSNSVVVSAPADLLATIEEMVIRIDQPISDETELKRFALTYADPSELSDELGILFPDPTATGNNSQPAGMPFFFSRRFGGGGPTSTSTAAKSDRMVKLAKVIAVPDPRTQSVLVTASKSMMPEIEAMIRELDADPGKREQVRAFDLVNADPQDVNNVLQTLFNRMTRQQTPTTQGMMGNQNPLTQREIQNQNTSGGAGTGLGSSRSGGFGGGGAGAAGGF